MAEIYVLVKTVFTDEGVEVRPEVFEEKEDAISWFRNMHDLTIELYKHHYTTLLKDNDDDDYDEIEDIFDEYNEEDLYFKVGYEFNHDLYTKVEAFKFTTTLKK